MGYLEHFEGLPAPAPFAEEARIRDLGDGLVLRRASRDDAEALAAFQRVAQAEPPGFEPLEWIGRWTRELADGSHPSVRAEDFTLVEDLGRKRIASSLCLISHRFSFEGVEIGAGQVELVATHPDYRRRGLVAQQFEVVHGWSDARGHALQLVDGIPNFYRRFGYEMALESRAYRIAPASYLPATPPRGDDALRVRPARESDLPFVSSLYDRSASRYLLHCLRDADFWRYELASRDPGSAMHRELSIVESPEGEPLACFSHLPLLLDGGFLYCFFCEVAPGVAWSRVKRSVLHALREVGAAISARDGGPFRGVGFVMGSEHPFYEVAEGYMPDRRRPYAWYVRCPDLPALLTRIAPVLEGRLAASPLAGHSGALALSFYASGVRLVFENGKLAALEEWTPSTEERGDLAFPGLCFLQLLLGFRSWEELYEAWPDCWPWRDSAVPLVEALFPPRPTHLWVTA